MKEHFVIDPLISKRQQLLLATQLCRMVLKVRYQFVSPGFISRRTVFFTRRVFCTFCATRGATTAPQRHPHSPSHPAISLRYAHSDAGSGEAGPHASHSCTVRDVSLILTMSRTVGEGHGDTTFRSDPVISWIPETSAPCFCTHPCLISGGFATNCPTLLTRYAGQQCYYRGKRRERLLDVLSLNGTPRGRWCVVRGELTWRNRRRAVGRG